MKLGNQLCSYTLALIYPPFSWSWELSLFGTCSNLLNFWLAHKHPVKLGHYTTIIYFARDHDLANLFQSCPQRTQKQVNEIKCMQVCLGFVLVNRRSYEVVCPEERKKKKKVPCTICGTLVDKILCRASRAPERKFN